MKPVTVTLNDVDNAIQQFEEARKIMLGKLSNLESYITLLESRLVDESGSTVALLSHVP